MAEYLTLVLIIFPNNRINAMLENAIQKDLNKNYLDAVKNYEQYIDNSSMPLIESFLNLAFIYWSFASQQMEFNVPNEIPDEWSIIGGNRFLSILEKGLAIYPNSLELIFWKYYFSHRLFGTEFSEQFCKELIKKYEDKDCLIPYFYLQLFDKNAYTNEINILKKICIELPTAKHKYIITFLP